MSGVPISVHHPLNIDLATRLKAARLGSNLTQVQLAERLGLGQSYVSKIEKSQGVVDVVLFINWCRACDTSAVDMLRELAGAER